MQSDFNITKVLVGLFMFIIPYNKALAHEIDNNKFAIEKLIPEMNLVASYITKQNYHEIGISSYPPLTNGDIAIIASIGCSTSIITRQELFLERARSIVVENYPTPEVVGKESFDSFFSFEKNVLIKYNASNDTFLAFNSYLKEHPDLPNKEVITDAVIQYIPTFEKITCDLRAVALKEPSAPASSLLVEAGKSVGKAVIGLGVVVGNVAFAVESGSAAAALAMISGGWGWNRCEEGFFELKKLWDSGQLQLP